MKRIFLSCHFGDSDRDLVRRVNQLLESHNVRVVMGDVLGGESLTPAVMERIEKGSDALVALMTPRSKQPTYGGTHPWVVDEFKHAKNLKKPAISVVWPDVDVSGAYTETERIHYDPDNAVDAFIKLSQTVGRWKKEAGRILKVQVFPEDIAYNLAAPSGGAVCKFRLYKEGTASDWKEGHIVPEGDGTYVYLPGVQDETFIQLEAVCNGSVWHSKAVAQSMPIELTTPHQQA